MSSKQLDKYYSTAVIVDKLLAQIENSSSKKYLEPSCGGGAFTRKLKGEVFAYDLLPECDNAVQQDFLSVTPFKVDIVVGNPPFGKMSNLAVKFFNHCAKFDPDIIAFVLPKTFNKPRFWGRLDSRYTLVWSKDCPKNSFTLDGEPYDVPCVMQVWEKKVRIENLPQNLQLFEEVPENIATVFIRRVGSKAGKIVDNYTPSSTYSIRCEDWVVEEIKKQSFKLNNFATNTVGVKSITLFEIEDILLKRYGGKQ